MRPSPPEPQNGSEPQALIRATVVLAHESTVEPQVIETRMLELFDLAESHGGEYDGWETPVCK